MGYFPNMYSGYMPYCPNPFKYQGTGVNNPPYTLDMFIEDFPQFGDKDFACMANINVQLLINQANVMILQSVWGESWRYAMGLCVAHFITLNASPNPQAGAAANGMARGRQSSKSVGDVSVSYDYGGTDAALREWGAFNLTTYGQQLATLARLIGLGGMYIW